MIHENRYKNGTTPMKGFGIRNLKYYVFEPDSGTTTPNCPGYGYGLLFNTTSNSLECMECP